MDWVWLSGLYFYDQSQPIIKKYFHNLTHPLLKTYPTRRIGLSRVGFSRLVGWLHIPKYNNY